MAAAERTTPIASGKQHRILACVHCQQRKIKCDREYPCGNCVKARIQCVQATQNPRQRRRRFPERELLERLRHYEGLLRQHSINFEPLHPNSTPGTLAEASSGGSNPADYDRSEAIPGASQESSASTTVETEPLSFWNAMNQRSRDEGDEDDSDSSNDGVRESDVKDVWQSLSRSNDHMLFGTPKSTTDLSTLHPENVQIFRLWQIYLENVDPIFKVTHTPTLQGRVIEAASNVANISPRLEPLMFGIYSVAVMSLDDEGCRTIFNSPRDELLTRYQYGCQQALVSSEYLRSPHRESLTALFLYLVSARPETDPRSLFPMLGVAIRIAQRLGIHSEVSNSKCTALEAEMRRRLWWALVLFDTRLCELSGCRASMLAPGWDCRTPLNLNDFELRPEMKELPKVQGHTAETLLAVVRSELGDYLRHASFYLDFTQPALKIVAKRIQRRHVADGEEVATLEKIVDERYLKFCNPENALHFMTILTTQQFLAKNHLMENYLKFLDLSVEKLDNHRDEAVTYALKMIECDTRIVNNPSVKGYRWLADLYFPFPAYVHIVQDLRKRPLSKHAERAWNAMNENYEARYMWMQQGERLFFRLFNKASTQAWDTLEEQSAKSGKPLRRLQLIQDIKDTATPKQQEAEFQLDGSGASMAMDDFSMPMALNDYGSIYGVPFLDPTISSMGSYSNVSGVPTMDADLSQFDWTAMDWNQMYNRGW